MWRASHDTESPDNDINDTQGLVIWVKFLHALITGRIISIDEAIAHEESA